MYTLPATNYKGGKTNYTVSKPIIRWFLLAKRAI